MRSTIVLPTCADNHALLMRLTPAPPYLFRFGEYGFGELIPHRTRRAP
ncbi:hypothetical protein [Actinomadura sp. KC345]|nr:hypothetical protein [Actinomadura sp. KC345]